MDPNLSEMQVDNICELFDNYTVFALADADMSQEELKCVPRKVFLEHSTVIYNNTDYSPLKADDIGEDMQQVLIVMKPIFSKMLGQFGEGMH